MKTSLLASIAISSLAFLGGVPAFAASESWEGGPGDWNSANWSPDGVPPGLVGLTGINSDSATFNIGSGTVVVDPYRNLNVINFNTGAGSYTLTGGPLVIGGYGSINFNAINGTNITQTIATPIIAEGLYQQFSINNNSTSPTNVFDITGGFQGAGPGAPALTLGGSNTGANTFSGVISNGGWQNGLYGNNWSGLTSLAKNGTGTWILSAANTFSGTTNISQGTLQLNNSQALQFSQVTVNSANGLAFASGLGNAYVAGLDGGSNQALTDIGNGAVNLTIGFTPQANTDTYTAC